jgi:hypothetical protein
MATKKVQQPKPKQAGRSSASSHSLDRAYPDDYRREEIQKLIKAIQAKEHRLVLGLPGMGKSSLLRFLVTQEKLVGRDVTFVYLNCYALDNCLDLEVFFATITRRLHEKGLGSKLKEELGGYTQLEQFVTRLSDNPQRRIVIVVDQADRMLSTADQIFYRRLKALTDLNKGIYYIFAASPLILDSIDPDYRLLFAGRIFPVGRLNDRDCTVVIVQEARRLKTKFSAVEQERLARLSGSHGGLLRAIASGTGDGLNFSDSEQSVIERLLNRGDVQDRCQRIWEALDPARQAMLSLLATGKPQSVTGDTLAWFQNFGLADRSGENYQLFSPIFRRFVEAQEVSAPSSELEPIKLEVFRTEVANDQEIVVAGQVFKGTQRVDVAPRELRLVACLKRKRRIYTKFEIEEYVYFDEKKNSKKEEWILPDRIAGLVHSVRKKLGNPGYIKAHWGRGYEFVG